MSGLTISSTKFVSFLSPTLSNSPKQRCTSRLSNCIFDPKSRKLTLLGAAGVALASTLLGTNPSCASELSLLGSSLLLNEPSNALSLPTWAIHVSSVVEWATAMALVWQYGERTGYESWKGLTWGMVLVTLQAALTVIGNATMCLAAYRIYKATDESSNDL